MDSTRETGSARTGTAGLGGSNPSGRDSSDGDGQDLRDGARDGRRGDTAVRGSDGPRFLQLADVAEVLSVSDTQVYALVRSGELRAIKLGGRGRWRVERTELQAYIDRMYDQTRAFIEAHPFVRAEIDG